MPRSVPEQSHTTQSNGTLNSAANPSENALIEEDQFFLGSADERCRVGASRIGALLKEAQRASGFTLSTLGGMVGKDAPCASRAFDVENPHTVVELLCAAFLLDKSRTLIRGINRMLGGEFVERPKLTPEQKFERLAAAVRRMGKAGDQFIAEALGEDSP